MSQEYRLSPTPTSRTGQILLLVWAAMTVAALGFVLGFGHNVPWGDEWEFVPVLTGHEPAGPWLWAQHNEHRLPLPRAVYLGLFRLTGDFRSGMVMQVMLLSSLALGLLRQLAAARGRPSWADVFVPVGLLNWGHVENFLMGYQLCFALVCVLACGIAVASRSERIYRAGLLVGGQMLLLAACGGSGLAFVPPVAVWLLARSRRVGRNQWKKGVDLIVLTVVVVGYAVAYFVGYERPPHHPPARLENAGLATMITGQFLSMGFGIAAVYVWPAVAAGIVGLTVWAASRLTRTRFWGVLAVLAGALLLAVAIGVGRSGFGDTEMGLWSRYGLLAWPVLFTAYLAFLNATDRFGRWVQPVLAAVTVGFLPFNLAVGWGWASSHDRRMSEFTRDVQAGVPTAELIEKHLAGTGQEERAVRGIPMLRDAGIGPFGARP
ncbi:MAG TPA: hypothetical protein VM533_00730 [Fimbriiglobus sp.]|jgi:hypothetical protein|nr:hypothetical protein [Fimbriiglobus sp.]